MSQKNRNHAYNSEQAIKGIAKMLHISALVHIILAFVAFVVFTSLALIEDDIEFYLPIAIVSLAGGLLLALFNIITNHLVWGYGEMVGNSQRTVQLLSTMSAPTMPDNGVYYGGYNAPAYDPYAYDPYAYNNAPAYGAPTYGAPTYGAPTYGAPMNNAPVARPTEIPRVPEKPKAPAKPDQYKRR